jgi:hypothetical protein
VRPLAAWLLALAACGHAASAPSPSKAQPAPVAVPRLKAPPPIDPNARGAAYLTAVALQLQPGWGQFLDDCRLRLPAEHPLNAMTLAATYELVIAPDGAASMAHAVSSGNADFDRAVHDVILDASPLPKPPEDLLSDDDRVHVKWLFARDGRQAGPATARIVDVDLPLGQVVSRRVDQHDLTRAARRIARELGHHEDETSEVARAVIHEGLTSSESAAQMAALHFLRRSPPFTPGDDYQFFHFPELRQLFSVPDEPELHLAVIEAAATMKTAELKSTFARSLQTELRTGDPAVAFALAHALVAFEFGDTSISLTAAVRPIALDKNEPDEVRAHALRLAAASPQLATELVSKFDGGSAEQRAAWCFALRATDLSVAAPRLARGLKDGDARVRRECVDAVATQRSHHPDDKQLLALAPRIRDLAHDRDHLVRARAVAALILFDLDLPVVRAADDPDREVREAYATEIAGHLTNAELRADAITLTKDRDPDVRAAAWRAIATAPPDTVPAADVVRAAADSSADVRAAVARVAPEDILVKLVASDESGTVRTEALISLAQRRGRQAMDHDILERIASSPPGSVERVRAAMAWLLAK